VRQVRGPVRAPARWEKDARFQISVLERSGAFSPDIMDEKTTTMLVLAGFGRRTLFAPGAAEGARLTIRLAVRALRLQPPQSNSHGSGQGLAICDKPGRTSGKLGDRKQS